MRQLLEEVNFIINNKKINRISDLAQFLTPLSQGVFTNLPDAIQNQIHTFVSPSTEVHRYRYVDA